MADRLGGLPQPEDEERRDVGQRFPDQALPPLLRGREDRLLKRIQLPARLERLKQDGKGWQTRANALLREALGL